VIRWERSPAPQPNWGPLILARDRRPALQLYGSWNRPAGMRIAQLVETLETGGLERVAVDLALSQKSAGHEPILYCLFAAGALEGEAKSAGVPVFEFHKKPGFSVETLFRLARQLRRDAPDVLHTHNPGVHHYGALAAWIARVPVVVNTRHGPATSFGHVYQERYFRAMMPLTDRVVFVCEDSRRYLVGQRGLSSRKSSVIANGIKLDPFLERPAAPGSASPRIRFGSVGRMVPVKAHSILIDAFAQVARKLPGAELRIVGGGPLEAELRERARKAGLNGRVRVEGTSDEIAGVLRDLDIFVLSSISEGLPLVILEAMAAGLPIVSTRIGGVPEVATEGAVSYLCTPGRADDLADAMYRAATSADLAKMGNTARETAIATFGLTQMWRGYEAIYAESFERK
jgi:glycosyltransferase involved in cell wall biosynthesis